VIESFANTHAQALFESGRSKQLSPDILGRARRKLESIDSAARLDAVPVPREIDSTSSGETEKDGTRASSPTDDAYASGSLPVILTMSKFRMKAREGESDSNVQGREGRKLEVQKVERANSRPSRLGLQPLLFFSKARTRWYLR